MGASTGVRPLDFLGSSALSRLNRAATAALEEWRLAWGSGRAAARVDCARAWELAKGAPVFEDGWECWECAEGSPPWLGASPALAAATGSLLFGGSAPLAAQVARRAADDLVGRLLVRFGGGEPRRANGAPALPGAFFQPGSGTAVLDLEMPDAKLRIVARAPHAAPPPRAPAPVGELQGAMHGVPVTLGVELAELDMELGTLQSLEAGDVIRLPLEIDQPLRIAAPDGRTVCFGDLGRLQGCRALALRKTAHGGAE
jgi:flagellar motor switch/type III secretory pathway protein FliN